MRSMIPRVLVACALGATLVPGRAVAQNPMDDLIHHARRALDNLEYARADSIARTLVTASGPGTRSYRRAGLQILSAALYPDEAWAQKPDSARKYLIELVKLAPAGQMPDGMSWPGLDALLADVRRATFAVRLDAAGAHTILGVDGRLALRAIATRPAEFRLVAEPVDMSGRPVRLDSTGGRVEMEVGVPIFRDGVRLLESGRYRLVLVATDPVSGERAEDVVMATVLAPPLERVTVPVAIDSTQLLPERSSPNRWRNGAVGLGLGVVTAFAGSLIGSADPLSGVGGDGRAYWMAGTLAVGALIGALLDNGAPLPANAEYNVGLHDAFGERVRSALAQNEHRRATYRATVHFEEM